MRGVWAGCLLMLLAGAMAENQRNVLVFGGNGLLGAATVERLIHQQDSNVTMVSRGNPYWDFKSRILPHVNLIKCNRQKEEPCEELEAFVKGIEEFDAVYDFSSYGPDETKYAIKLLKGKVGVYVYISTDSVYDVCSREKASREQKSVESDAHRPQSLEEQDMLNHHHMYGHRKLQAEEELTSQRDEEDGFPFVIFRLPDVLGPRDTTHRMWLYLLWIKMAPYFRQHPVQVPYFLKDYGLSFVYVDDVARMAVAMMDKESEVLDQVYNLAWPDTITLEELLRTLESELDPERHQGFNIDEKGTSHYYYPTVRRGPISVEKAERMLGWSTTPLRQAMKYTVRFYEDAMRDDLFRTQREEIIQICQKQLFQNESTSFYKRLEELYDIDLKHFINTKEEL